MLAQIKGGKRNIIAVLDDGKLAGTISLDDLRPWLFGEAASATTTISKLMKVPKVIVANTDDVRTILMHFDRVGTAELPVSTASGEFAGFIVKATVLDSYRKLLQEYS